MKLCLGCAVEGFADHHCRGEIVTVETTGQAHIVPCGCELELACRNHKAATQVARPVQTSPFGYMGARA